MSHVAPVTVFFLGTDSKPPFQLVRRQVLEMVRTEKRREEAPVPSRDSLNFFIVAVEQQSRDKFALVVDREQLDKADAKQSGPYGHFKHCMKEFPDNTFLLQLLVPADGNELGSLLSARSLPMALDTGLAAEANSATILPFLGSWIEGEEDDDDFQNYRIPYPRKDMLGDDKWEKELVANLDHAAIFNAVAMSRLVPKAVPLVGGRTLAQQYEDVYVGCGYCKGKQTVGCGYCKKKE
jgi:hypothetical protein